MVTVGGRKYHWVCSVPESHKWHLQSSVIYRLLSFPYSRFTSMNDYDGRLLLCNWYDLDRFIVTSFSLQRLCANERTYSVGRVQMRNTVFFSTATFPTNSSKVLHRHRLLHWNDCMYAQHDVSESQSLLSVCSRIIIILWKSHICEVTDRHSSFSNLFSHRLVLSCTQTVQLPVILL